MNNIYNVFVILLINVGVSFGMDKAQVSDSSASLLNTKRKKLKLDMVAKVWPIRHYSQIMNIPMRDIRCSVEKLSSEQQETLKQSLGSSFTFAIAMLPKELCLKIIRLGYDEDDQRYNSKSVFCMPMLQVINLHEEFQNNPIKIGGKKMQLSTFFMLTQEERNSIRSAVNPSPVSSFLEGTSSEILSQENYDTVIELIPELADATELIILPSYYQRARIILCSDGEVFTTNIALFWIAGLGAMQIPLALGKILYDDNPLASGILYCVGGVVDISILLAGALHGISRCRDYIVERSQHNRAV